MFGRQDERAAVREAIKTGHRLISIEGPAGVGKTILARSISRVFAPFYFCELASAQTMGEACGRICSALGIHPGDRPLGVDGVGVALAEHAGQRRVYVVLDNIEQLGPPLQRALRSWMLQAPTMVFITTSRFRVDMSETRPIKIEPFSVEPGPDGRSPAVELLAYLAQRQLRLDDAKWRALEEDTRAACDRIVRRLAGLPLALRLAAAQLTVFSFDELARLLEEDSGDQRMLALLDDPEPLDARQSSMTAALRWSWGLLEPVEQQVLIGLSAFPGTFSHADAAQVMSSELRPGVRQVLVRLSRKALVHRAETTHASRSPRFCLDSITREFIRADPDRAAACRRAAELHTQWFIDEGCRMARCAIGDRDDTQARRKAAGLWITTHRADLHEARRFAASVTPRDAALLQGAEVALSPLRRAELSKIEVQRELAEVLETDDDRTTSVPALRGELLRLLARTHRFRDGDLGACLELLGRASQLARASEDQGLEARVHNAFAEAFGLQRRLDEAEKHSRGALALHESRGATGWIGISLCQLGRFYAERGQIEQACRCWEDALQHLVAIDDPLYRCIVHQHQSSVAIEALDFSTGRARAEQAATIADRAHMHREKVIAQAYVALAAHHERDVDEVVDEYGRLIALFETLGAVRFVAYFRYYRGIARLELDDHAGAAADFRAARHVPDARFEGLALAAEAALAARSGRPSAALREAAENRLNDDELTDIKAVLGLVDVADALRRGRHTDASNHAERMHAVPCDEVRLVARVAVGWCSRWQIARSGTWFQSPGGKRTRIPSRQVFIAQTLWLLATARPKSYVPSETLLNTLWPGGGQSKKKLSEVIARLRTHLKKHELTIQNKRNVGYRFDPPVVFTILDDPPPN